MSRTAPCVILVAALWSAPLLASSPACPADLNCDGVVNPADLAMLLGAWGPCPGCDADFNQDGVINAADLAVLLGSWGPCQAAVCGTIAGIICPGPMQFCLLCDGSCNIADPQGLCVPVPQGCPEIFDPVCGCDGQTYGNRCEALSAGVQVEHGGPCAAICGGFAGIPCEDPNTFCEFPPGTCEVADNLGVCVPIPEVCPLFFDPVCGCDGVTYDNACFARQAEQSIDHEGPCAQVCGTLLGIPCEDPGTFCLFPPGTCEVADNAGICVPIPQACDDVFDPVCGCDGVTYGNECEAHAVGQSVDHPGSCKQPICGGFAGIPCEDPNTFCEFPPGTCEVVDNAGVCVPIPDVCPEIFDPVCGCDGVTYDNACFAQQAGQSVDHDGPCDPGFCGGLLNLPCLDPNTFCEFPPGTCGNGDIPGTCILLPDECPAVFDPVCGCDGNTYSNTCFAQQAGQSIDHSGPCGELCGTLLGIPCEDPGTFCEFPPGTCAVADNAGVCVLIPKGCGGDFTPVCGCDGMTYSNACVARQAQQSIDHPGECP